MGVLGRDVDGHWRPRSTPSRQLKANLAKLEANPGEFIRAHPLTPNGDGSFKVTPDLGPVHIMSTYAIGNDTRPIRERPATVDELEDVRLLADLRCGLCPRYVPVTWDKLEPILDDLAAGGVSSITLAQLSHKLVQLRPE